MLWLFWISGRQKAQDIGKLFHCHCISVASQSPHKSSARWLEAKTNDRITVKRYISVYCLLEYILDLISNKEREREMKVNTVMGHILESWFSTIARPVFVPFYKLSSLMKVQKNAIRFTFHVNKQSTFPATICRECKFRIEDWSTDSLAATLTILA